jgi:hypothetical protein
LQVNATSMYLNVPMWQTSVPNAATFECSPTVLVKSISRLASQRNVNVFQRAKCGKLSRQRIWVLSAVSERKQAAVPLLRIIISSLTLFLSQMFSSVSKSCVHVSESVSRLPVCLFGLASLALGSRILVPFYRPYFCIRYSVLFSSRFFSSPPRPWLFIPESLALKVNVSPTTSSRLCQAWYQVVRLNHSHS